MGRIVYFSFPAHGHVNPTLPVIRELTARGEQVSYFGTSRFARAVAETGAQFCPYTARVEMPEHGPGPFAQVSTTLETLLDFCGAVLDDHLDAVRRWRPTHVMFDSFAPWGRMVAQLLGLPGVASVPSILINRAIDERYGARPGRPPEDPRLTPQWCSWFRARCHTRLLGYQLPEPLTPPQLLQTYGDLNLVYTSTLFQPLAEDFDGRRFHFVGPCCSFRPDAPPFPFERLDDRPAILISLGTVYAQRPDFLRTCMQELGGGPWQVVLATGGQVNLPGPLPRNFIVRASVPQVEILRRASAFITHGGMNSVQEALYYGVPMVLAPQAADQFWISARTAELGAGIVVDSERLHPGAIRSSVAALLSGVRYAASAARLAQSLHAAGGPGRAADAIQCSMTHTGWPAGTRQPDSEPRAQAGSLEFSKNPGREENAGALGC
ncbi:MAG TPA: macrolide family glycosyltransferase [Bryobacteraceae bacterium]|jgi:MGT family glycosyltransferase|nr:macrolide family glycosyltransferase [Bryobacteraceae bacterium]